MEHPIQIKPRHTDYRQGSYYRVGSRVLWIGHIRGLGRAQMQHRASVTHPTFSYIHCWTSRVQKRISSAKKIKHAENFKWARGSLGQMLTVEQQCFYLLLRKISRPSWTQIILESTAWTLSKWFCSRMEDGRQGVKTDRTAVQDGYFPGFGESRILGNMFWLKQQKINCFKVNTKWYLFVKLTFEKPFPSEAHFSPPGTQGSS